MGTVMKLGGVALYRNPHVDSPPDLITPARKTAWVETYGSGAFFSWGLDVVGLPVELKFGHVPESFYQQLLAIYTADEEIEFDPCQGDGKVYTVQMTDLKGKFFTKLNSQTVDVWRKDVEATLLITGEV